MANPPKCKMNSKSFKKKHAEGTFKIHRRQLCVSRMLNKFLSLLLSESNHRRARHFHSHPRAFTPIPKRNGNVTNTVTVGRSYRHRVPPIQIKSINGKCKFTVNDRSTDSRSMIIIPIGAERLPQFHFLHPPPPPHAIH